MGQKWDFKWQFHFQSGEFPAVQTIKNGKNGNFMMKIDELTQMDIFPNNFIFVHLFFSRFSPCSVPINTGPKLIVISSRSRSPLQIKSFLPTIQLSNSPPKGLNRKNFLRPIPKARFETLR